MAHALTGEEFEKIRRKPSNKKPLRTNSGEEEVLVTTPDNLEVSSSRLRENKIGGGTRGSEEDLGEIGE